MSRQMSALQSTHSSFINIQSGTHSGLLALEETTTPGKVFRPRKSSILTAQSCLDISHANVILNITTPSWNHLYYTSILPELRCVDTCLHGSRAPCPLAVA